MRYATDSSDNVIFPDDNSRCQIEVSVTSLARCPVLSLHCRARMRVVARLAVFLVLAVCFPHATRAQELLDERVVLHTSLGNIELAFYRNVAPVTAQHILELFKRGAYDTNHFFRVDKGFVAQVADVVGGRRALLDTYQAEIARDTVPGEFQTRVVHRRGTLSMGRYDDPNSGSSSFSILLGNAPHLDNRYTVFGEMISGDETLREMENAETRREGIFVTPRDRIEIISTYVKKVSAGANAVATGDCATALEDATHRANGLALELEEIRQKRLPGR